MQEKKNFATGWNEYFQLDNTANSTCRYDRYGRLNQINGLGGRFQYSYLTNSGLHCTLVPSFLKSLQSADCGI